jgi:hypothetical protein
MTGSISVLYIATGPAVPEKFKAASAAGSSPEKSKSSNIPDFTNCPLFPITMHLHYGFTIASRLIKRSYASKGCTENRRILF